MKRVHIHTPPHHHEQKLIHLKFMMFKMRPVILHGNGIINCKLYGKILFVAVCSPFMHTFEMCGSGIVVADEIAIRSVFAVHITFSFSRSFVFPSF